MYFQTARIPDYVAHYVMEMDERRRLREYLELPKFSPGKNGNFAKRIGHITFIFNIIPTNPEKKELKGVNL